jgi:hypothetical protein
MLANEYVLVFLFAIGFCPGLTLTIMLHNIFLSLVILFGFSSGLDFINPAQQKALAVVCNTVGLVEHKILLWLII